MKLLSELSFYGNDGNDGEELITYMSGGIAKLSVPLYGFLTNFVLMRTANTDGMAVSEIQAYSLGSKS